MPIQMLDIIVAAVMIVSGLLALMRGFTREVLSLIAWGLAAVAGVLAALNPELNAIVAQYLPHETLAKVVLGAAVFLIVLIIVSVISVRIADWVLDSGAGPFDRTFGLFYGLARGLLLVVIAYLFYVWLVPIERREDWVREAKSLPVIERVGGFVLGFMPPDIADTLRQHIAATGAGEEPKQPGAEGEDDEGYKSGQTRVLDQLIESTQSGQQQPPPAQQPAPQEELTDPEDIPAFGGQNDQSGQN